MEHKVICVLAVVLMLAFSSLAQTQAQEETCIMAPHERKNCGFPGVTAQQCAKRGCCFDDSVRGFPWCFHSVAIENTQEEECPF
ncbi:trefoil factor 1 [Mus caroli]|uniref:Trefoil factor 1 n=1 Tax=Mus caroli TaxID=10089 RepID=A0A6P5RDB6_MUSCR|nr:trefoil factor 1 [Mus caroli]